MQYFDICKPVTFQVDSSQKGLGVALLQDGCPVAFASKGHIPVEQHELLTCFFGTE